MRLWVLVTALLLILQAPVTARTVTEFEGGSPEAWAELDAPECQDTIHLTLPAECHVRRATMNLSSMPPDPGCPKNVSVWLNDTLLWEFNGTDFGAVGMQDSFSGGVSEWMSELGAGGGENSTSIRLPRKAAVRNATLEVDCRGPGGYAKLTNFTGDKPNDAFGTSVSSAGDVNGDGCCDIIVGAVANNGHTGAAYIYFGGAELDTKEDVVLTGEASWHLFGCSVSGAGDVNGDGFDDVIVGAIWSGGTGLQTGRAYLFLGGAKMDSIADVVFDGAGDLDGFGCSVSGAGDLDNDGFDDLIVGAYCNDSNGADSGCAYVYFGGPNMDGAADLTILGGAAGDYLGFSVSGAGDMNNDGYADVIVGAFSSDRNGQESGAAHLYLGGRNMDNRPDCNFSGAAAQDQFGISVSDAGDVNGDGYDDAVMGAHLSSGASQNSGAAFIFFGGETVDADADVTLRGEGPNDYFGYSVCGAGDVDGDGIEDVIVGAWESDATASNAGRAYIYLGGEEMDNVADMVFTGEAEGDRLGCAVSGAGDFWKNGETEVIVGAPNADVEEGLDNGKAYLFGRVSGIMDPFVDAGGTTLWNASGYSDLTNTTGDFAPSLNSYLSTAIPNGTDGFGNAYVDVPVRIGAPGAGNITLLGLNITYDLTAAITGFSDRLNDYIAAHGDERDAGGNITVPIRIVSCTPGGLRLSGLSIVVDEAPGLVERIPGFQVPEDSVKEEAVDLFAHFEDDYDVDSRLRFEVVSVTNGTIVKVEITGNRFLRIDALEGESNDNWTGVVDIVVGASDSRGLAVESNPFRVRITNVPDPPVITSTPPGRAVRGERYEYNVTALDGDGDPLRFYLKEGPYDMTVDLDGGRVGWTPSVRGEHDISLFVTDSIFHVYQNYTLAVPNSPPRISDPAVPEAPVGVPLSFVIPAVDDDGDPLEYTLLSHPAGMTIDPATGLLEWMPERSGDFDVSVSIDDGLDRILHDFTIRVVEGNRAPVFTSPAVVRAIAGIPYTYDARAADADGDALTYSLESGPEGMTVGVSSGKVNWTPGTPGNFTVRLMASDGRGGEAFQEFTINVLDRVKAKVDLTAPTEGQKIKGKFTIRGTAVKGTLDIVKVQIKVDTGEWTDTTGNASWSYVLDTTKLKNGKHTIEVRAYDGMDYSEVVNRTVTVDIPKSEGRGFIPGFTGPLLVLAILPALALAIGRKRRQEAGRAG